jgi:hypothetical protein
MKMPRAANLAVEMVVFIRSSFVNEFTEAVGRMPEWIEIEKIISIPLHGSFYLPTMQAVCQRMKSLNTPKKLGNFQFIEPAFVSF